MSFPQRPYHCGKFFAATLNRLTVDALLLTVGSCCGNHTARRTLTVCCNTDDPPVLPVLLRIDEHKARSLSKWRRSILVLPATWHAVLRPASSISFFHKSYPQDPMIARLCSTLLILAFFSPAVRSQAPLLQLEKNDHVVWVGNTFAERMQYFGEVEARLHARYPGHNLVVRNLAWSADTVSLRPRPKNFGDIHHYLSETKADVILACCGFNETWDYDGERGISRFKDDLNSFLKSLQGHQYNGRSAPKIVLYSPIACEASVVPNAAARNRLLQRYSKAMSESADSLNIPFVDLFGPSQQLFRTSTQPTHTINGIHLTSDGYSKLATDILSDQLFTPLPAGAPLDAIRAEVREKNDTFFNWYRTVNSFYIHGDRHHPYGVVNFPLERKKLLQMTSVRDQRIWKAARGETLPAEIDDSSTVSIPTTLPGSRGGTSPALSPAEERAGFEVEDGFQVELFASEQEFPELRNPVCINFDAEGRLWVATMASYPHALPGIKANDQIIILEDTNGDGKADKNTVFAEDLYLPLGFEFGHGGVYVSQEPNLVFLQDTDNDGKADRKTILLHGFGSEDSHHAIHRFVWGPGGGLYMQESVFHHTQVETIYGPRRSRDNAVYRFDPRTQKFDVVSPLPPGGNPWGHAINRWGEHLYVGSHLNAALINHSEAGHIAAPPIKNQDVRYCGQEFITSRHWPDQYQGKVFSNQYKNYQGVLLHDWTTNGSSFNHQRLAKVFEAHNRACIPVDLQLGPDGALYVADWYNPVLGHMQYSLRDERRDSKMGRIWRITWKDRPLDTPPNIAGATVEQLLDHLKSWEDRTRYRTRRVLWNLPDETLKPALDKWLSSLDSSHADHQHRPAQTHHQHHVHQLGHEHHRTEALWLHQQRGWINPDLFQRVATSPDYNARAAAAHLLRFWSEDLPDARSHFLRLAADKHAKVRMETLVSSTWADPSIAIEVLEIISELPLDEHLKIAWNNSRKALAPALKNHPMALPPDQLARLPLTDQVLKAIIRRPELPGSLRQKVLAHLSSKQKTTTGITLVDIITDLDQRSEASLPDWLAILDSRTISARETLNPLLNSGTPDVRQAAFAALIRSDHLVSVPLDPDALRSITRTDSRELRNSFLAPAQQALSSSESLPVRQAALFSLGRVPGHDKLIFNILAQHFVNPELTPTAAEAILARPQKTWPLEETTDLLKTHLPILTSTPVEKRGGPSFTLASGVLTEIAKLRNLPGTLEKIHALQLVPVSIATVPDRMRYDRASIRVPSGTPVELRLDNSDVMKHNLVLCAPGALRKVGLAADALLTDPTAIERDWIPDLPEVLHSSPMANPNESVVLRFIAPEKPGSYPFLCSVPNHWRIMQGTMIVTDASSTSTAGKNSNILILTGEYEYQTRETLSAFAKHLRKDHQLNVVHIEANKKDNPQHFPDLDRHLPNADLLILSLRFLNLVPDQYQAIDQHLTHKPFIAIRTTTHLFRFPADSDLASENRAFPTRHFGTPYRGHHGHDSSQVNYVMAARHPVMAGVEPRFWTPDFLYAVNPLSVQCAPLMVGQGLKGLQPAAFRKVDPDNHVTVLSDQDQSRLIGTPHPLVWTIENRKEDRRALVSTIGARKSFDNPNVRRLYRNAVLWCLDRDPDLGLSPSEPLETVLLKDSLDTLARDARELGSIQRGRALFYGAAIGCAKCHDPVAGQPLGPDLMKKRDTKDAWLVESILRPSRAIHEGYQTVLVSTAAGRIHTGFHLRENETTLVIRDSVLGEKILEFNKSDLEELTRLQRSTMPAGLVNQLKNRSEFLDLVRFVMAAADGDLRPQSRTSSKDRVKPEGAR